MSGFVAVLFSPPDLTSPASGADRPGVRSEPEPAGLRAELAAAGAVAVLDWSELAEAPGASRHSDDDLPAVLFEPHQDPADLRRVLDALAADDSGPTGSLRGPGDTVVATTRPVTDTLKLVASDGRLTGTADRELHRFVDLPIAASLGLLRVAAERLDFEAGAGAAAQAVEAADSLATGLEPGDDEFAPVGPVEVLGALAGAGATVLSCPAGSASSSHRVHRPH